MTYKKLAKLHFDSSGWQVDKVFKREIIHVTPSSDTITTTQCQSAYDYITCGFHLRGLA